MQASIQQQRGIDGFLWRELVFREAHSVFGVVLCQIGEITLTSSRYRSAEFMFVEEFVVHHRRLAVNLVTYL